MSDMFGDNDNERQVFTVIVDYTDKTVGIKWVGDDGEQRGVVVNPED